MSGTNRKGPIFDPGICRCCGSIKKCRVLNTYRIRISWTKRSVFRYVYRLLWVDDLDGTVESERLICAACVARLRDACSFRVQVLRCEEKLLKANIHIHQPNEKKESTEMKTEVIKKEITESAEVYLEINIKEDVHKDNSSDTITVKKEMADKPLKRRLTDTEDKCERDVVLRMQSACGKKIKKMEKAGQEPPKPPKEPAVRLKIVDKDDQLFHNCATIVEYSYVCPFETSFSDYHCVYCRQAFSDPAELRAHTLGHAPQAYRRLARPRRPPQVDVARVDCRLCEDKIQDLRAFKAHITAKHHKYLFPKIQNELLQFKLTLSHLACTECDSTFGYFRILRSHMAVHFGSCICDVCGAHFFDEKGLAKHQKIHQKKPAGVFPCKDCGKEFKSKKGLYIHTTTTHKKKPIHQCGKCEEVFFSFALRCRHRIEVHGEKREFSCQHCDKTYDNMKSWREHNQTIHLKTKLKIPKHKCNVCDRMFYLPYQLKDHMTTHTGERNFGCEFCGKSYPRLKALRLHMKSHSENKYRCGVCDATFTQNVSLRNHVKKQHQTLEMETKSK